MSACANQLNHFSVSWAALMWGAIWQGSIVIMLIWAGTNLASRVFPAFVRAWLWRIALLKLVTALFWVSPIQLPLLRPKPSVHQDEVLTSDPPPVLDPIFETTVAGPYGKNEVFRHPSGFTVLTVESWIFLAWSFGVLFVVLRTVRQADRTRALVGRANALNDPTLKNICANLARRLSCRRAPKLLVSDETKSPMLVGYFSPVIVLPSSLVEASDVAKVRMIFAHELAHLKRHDLVWMWLPSFARCLYFLSAAE